MIYLVLIAIFCGFGMSAPLAEPIEDCTNLNSCGKVVPRAAAGALLSVSLGVSSPLIAVGLGSTTVVAVNLGSLSTAASSARVIMSTITAAPTSTNTQPTALPSTFTAPVQGQGKLSLDNLPALPAVIDKTFSGILGSVYGLSKP